MQDITNYRLWKTHASAGNVENVEDGSISKEPTDTKISQKMKNELRKFANILPKQLLK